MARKTEQVRIDQEGRDKGKLFTLTEMPAGVAEKWAYRGLHTLVRAGMELPDGGSAHGGLAALARLFYAEGFFTSLFRSSPDEMIPLLDELLYRCVEIHNDPARTNIKRAVQLNDEAGDDIEEIGTRIYLRLEVFKLHVGFSNAGDPSKGSPSPTSPAATT